MTSYTIVLVVGSLRRDSLNRKLAIAVEKLAPSMASRRRLSTQKTGSWTAA